MIVTKYTLQRAICEVEQWARHSEELSEHAKQDLHIVVEAAKQVKFNDGNYVSGLQGAPYINIDV